MESGINYQNWNFLIEYYYNMITLWNSHQRRLSAFIILKTEDHSVSCAYICISNIDLHPLIHMLKVPQKISIHIFWNLTFCSSQCSWNVQMFADKQLYLYFHTIFIHVTHMQICGIKTQDFEALDAVNSKLLAWKFMHYYLSFVSSSLILCYSI